MVFLLNSCLRNLEDVYAQGASINVYKLPSVAINMYIMHIQGYLFKGDRLYIMREQIFKEAQPW